MPTGSPARSVILRLAAAMVVTASVVSGTAAIFLDIRLAFRYAGKSVYTELDRRQLAQVRAAVPAGQPVLIAAPLDERWHALLWQRALFPDREPIVRYLPLNPADLAQLARQRAAWRAVVMNEPPLPLRLESSKDLDHLAGRTAHAWLGDTSYGRPGNEAPALPAPCFD